MPIHGYPGNVISATPPSVTVNGASGVFTTEQQMQYQAAGNWPMAATQISRSLRFNSADSAYLDRTPASASNQKTWTWSGWVKKTGTTSPSNAIIPFFGAQGGQTDATVFIIGSYQDFISIQNWNTAFRRTSVVFRDYSAWYHIVVSLDTTQATAANRLKLYVNNVEVTQFSISNDPALNTNYAVNSATSHKIFTDLNPSGGGNYLSGYLTEVNFIDGQALTPASFGVTDPATGVWGPRQYTGPYGTNGFYLNFSDNSGTTSTTLGKDYSGNGNNWTPNNFSVTAGAGNDSLVDTPTPYGTDTGAGGEVRGNYATVNALNASGSTLSNGNLTVVTSTVAGGGRFSGTIAVRSGKWYWEVTPTAIGSDLIVGIAPSSEVVKTEPGFTAGSYSYYSVNGNKYNNSSASSYGASFTTNDVIGVALDLDAGTLVFYKNGSSQGTAYSSLSGEFVPAFSPGSSAGTTTVQVNFGQRPFAYTAPSGFKALCTQNLPTPTIGATSTTQAGKYFNTVLYTGTGSSLGVTGVGFQPDWVWIKERNGAADHGLYDAVRGVQKQLESNTITAETTETTGLTAFNSDGFTVGALAQLNTNTDTYVAWNWKANGAGSSNTAGSITSTVSVNTTAGFSIVTWTGNSQNATIGHGLGVAPSMYIIKYRGTTDSWYAYHISTGAGNYLVLNGTDASTPNTNIWQNTAPTSTVFSIGFTNNASTIVAYCFAAVEGYSAFGSYTGNGSTDGPFVYTGFRPAFVLMKVTSTTDSWVIVDRTRSPYNVAKLTLFPNLSNAENDGSIEIDMLSNGFKLRTANSNVNASQTFIYAAFAENPFKYSLAR